LPVSEDLFLTCPRASRFLSQVGVEGFSNILGYVIAKLFKFRVSRTKGVDFALLPFASPLA